MRQNNFPRPRTDPRAQQENDMARRRGRGDTSTHQPPARKGTPPQEPTDRRWRFLCRVIDAEADMLPRLEEAEDERLSGILTYIESTREIAEEADQIRVLDASEAIVRRVYEARGQTVRQAQKLLQTHAREGISCPCCNTLHRIYRRAFNTSLARTLIWMVRASDAAIAAGDPDGWVYPNRDAPPGVKRANEWGRLGLWDCVDAGTAEDGGAYHYRATELARGMVRGERTVPRQVEVFLGDIRSFSEDSIKLSDAIGDAFDLSVLMQAALTNGEEWDLRALERIRQQQAAATEKSNTPEVTS